MPRYLRYLRILFSAFCGIACVLLIMLWVRSYWHLDWISHGSDSSYLDFNCTNGAGTLYWNRTERPLRQSEIGWHTRSEPAPDDDPFRDRRTHWFVSTK